VDDEALRLGIGAQPNIIKPNIHELSGLVGKELKDLEEIVAAARDINRQGVEIVLVSMGARGMLRGVSRARIPGGPARSEGGEHHWSRRLFGSGIYQRFW